MAFCSSRTRAVLLAFIYMFRDFAISQHDIQPQIHSCIAIDRYLTSSHLPSTNKIISHISQQYQATPSKSTTSKSIKLILRCLPHTLNLSLNLTSHPLQPKNSRWIPPLHSQRTLARCTNIPRSKWKPPRAQQGGEAPTPRVQTHTED
ncbi:hypothetical protein BKA65DRAFT_76468 [Rhexocercosporidium sp. MPI-PUGE-AT-0058]|nr:hypothetical protein BKA65DRAFT_76468 [Rhexocercosporidium sp. MPI-PUGE-AT-0058]